MGLEGRVWAARSVRAFGKHPSTGQMFLERHLCARNYSRRRDTTVNQANEGCVLTELVFSSEDSRGFPENLYVTPRPRNWLTWSP